ncbi:type IV pilus assembly protein PilM [Persephonella hydrogeniphila]|uniref:Type IV pilus assembly protein PilM n=1 Tax=Persephonella hydrogeniphila TaxID=198703 RepID=A0A285N3U5_9AQUI|nr:pilus assembly protein PilM [Persephonella hydrogeniphila]SNZ04100.1 type IV pilus assembly protein PilM [Persephonella hydrogeniphila]
MNILEKIKEPISGVLQKEKVGLGIQLDRGFARVALLSKEGGHYIIPVMPFEVSLVDNKEQAGMLLKEELEKRDINIKNAVVSIPTASTLFKTLKIPKMSPKEIEEAVEWNIREDIKSLKGTTVYDYDIIGEDGENLIIVVVISKIDDIENIREIMKYAGVEPDIIDSEGIALLNLAEAERKNNPDLKEESNICIIHLDINDSYLIFFHENITVQSLNFDSKKYEELDPDDKEKAIDRLINEINYFFLTINEPKIIYTSGFFAKFPEIQAYMQLKFSTRFTLVELDPVKALNIEFESSIPLSIYNIPFGLAYRRIGHD